MINEENLSMLYNDVIDGDELSTKILNRYGFTSKDLNDLINDGIIKRVKRGIYEINSVEKLFNYGTTLRINKEYEKADLCFEKCFELDPNNYESYSELFLRAIGSKNYDKIYSLYDHVYSLNNPKYTTDYNYYLYLLSFITDLPNEYKDYIKYLNIEYIKIDEEDERYVDVENHNKSRIAALNKKFKYAMKLLKVADKAGRSYDEESSVEFYIVKTLLEFVIDYEDKCKITLITLMQDKKYEKAIEFLIKKQSRHILSSQDEYTLKLLNDYINIRNTHELPVNVNSNDVETVYGAIDNRNYKLALEICNNYNIEHNLDENSNQLTIILNHICVLINEIEYGSNNGMVNEKNELKEDKDADVELNVNGASGSFSSIISNLMNKNLDAAFVELNKYMSYINCAEYEFLIINLIKLSLLENDIAFTKPMLALTMVSRNDYTFDISVYIQEFYISLSQNKFEESRIYLDIISKGNQLGQDCILTDGLKEVLEQAEKSVGYISKTNLNPSYFQDKVEIQTREPEMIENKSLVQEPPRVEPTKLTLPVNVSGESYDSASHVKKQPLTYEDDTNMDEELIEKKHDELVANHGILLLKPMNGERRKKIHDLVRKYLDIESFEIGQNKNIQIVLRYKNKTYEYVDFKALIQEGNTAYKDNDYNKCIECFSKLLENGKPTSFVYSTLGLAYMKNQEIEKAIVYMTVADDLAKKEGNDKIDFENLILRLKGKKVKELEDKKPIFKMQEDEFNYDDMSDYYGINNFDEINSYILESELDVETACINLGMNEEQINIIRLIYAKIYYSQKEFERGDLFLKSVELSKVKTQIIMNAYNEVRRNKKFYFNRPVMKDYHLSLTLKPKRKS